MQSANMKRRIKLVYEWLTDLIDRFRQYSAQIFSIPLSIIRWLLLVITPFILGAIGEDIIQEAYRSSYLFNIQYWIKNWLFSLIIISYLFILLWQRTHNYKVRHSDRIYYALKWFYDEMKFGNQQQADIRCTVWVPTSNNHQSTTLRMMQLVDYVPRKSQLSITTNFRPNGKNGRIFIVSKMDSSVEVSIGILGKCAVDSVRKREPGVFIESVPIGENFVEYMIRNWNFPERHAKRLTKDRRSYMCLAMMDSGNTRLIGVIYCDSRDPNTFSTKLGKKAENYLPRFAELLTM